MRSPGLKTAAPLVVYILVLTAYSVLAFRTPKPGTWDILAYTGNVAAQHTNDFIAIHHYAYQQVATNTSAANFEDLTRGSAYRQIVAGDPVLFGMNLPYYSIRPLYIAVLNLGTTLGVNPVRAASGIAALSYFGIGLVTFLWMRRHVASWMAFAAASLLMLAGPTLLLGRLYTPDGMAACAILVAMYLIIEVKQLVPGLILLLASVFIRTDTVICVGCVLVLLMLVTDDRIRLRRGHASLLIAIAVLSVVAINHFSGNYGYASLMHNQFVSESDPPDSPTAVSVSLYIKALMSPWGLPAVLHGSALPFMLLSLFVVVRSRSVLRDMTWAVLFASAAHFVIFPLFQDRLFAFAYILCAIAAVATLENPFANSLSSARVAESVNSDRVRKIPEREDASEHVSSL